MDRFSFAISNFVRFSFLKLPLGTKLKCLYFLESPTYSALNKPMYKMLTLLKFSEEEENKAFRKGILLLLKFFKSKFSEVNLDTDR